MTEEPTTLLKIYCLCGASKFSCDVPNSMLPLDETEGFCHCNSCRHVNGNMTFEVAKWPTSFPSDTSTMTKYRVFPTSELYFCSTCGTTMFWKGDDGFLGFTIGPLDNARDLVKFSGHIFIGDTKDGGISEWLPSIKGIEMKRHKTYVEDLPIGWKEDPSTTVATCHTLKAYCHCKGVQFSVKRPTKTLEQPEFIDPSAEQLGVSWLDSSGHRYVAWNCVCDSCRLSAGNDIMAWTSIPGENIVLPDGASWSRAATWGSLKTYNSSAGVFRGFCGTCGASILFSKDTRPNLLDVAVGILAAEEGARAEGWLHWDLDRVGHRQEGLDRGLLTQDLIDGMKQWKERDLI